MLFVYFVVNVIIFHKIEVSSELSCPDFKALNTKVSIEDLERMDKEDIVECLSFLGKEPLNYQVGNYIWNALVKIRGGLVENVVDADLREAGWILQHVAVDDLGNLTLNEVDTIAALGQFRNFSEQQMLAERVQEDWANKEPSDYTYYDLIALQHILCGFNRSSIEAIHADSYKEAAGTLATLRGCPTEPLEALASLAQAPEAFGPTTSWVSSQLKTVGCVINGLPTAILATIPPAGFEAITPDVIPCILPETLKMLNSAQLSHLTPSSVTALIPQQQLILTREQRLSIAAAYEVKEVKKSGAVAAMPQCFLILSFCITVSVNHKVA